MKNTFFAVMVICNRKIENSLSFKSLEKLGVPITVCDNSTGENSNADIASQGVTYISMGGNLGLAKAYNRALDSLKGKDGYVCLFDDDTEVPADYFEKLDAEIEKNSADIVLPVIRDKVGIMSPCIIGGAFTKRIDSLTELNEGNISGINSGMAINLKLFESYRYDENYFLDFIDHAFIRDMKAKNAKISVAETLELFQSFSANDHKNINAAKRRFRIFKKDFTYFCSQSGDRKTVLQGKLYLLKRQFNINVLYRLGM